MPQPDWDALSQDVRDLQSRIARIEIQLGLAGVSQPAAQQPVPVAPQEAPLVSAPTNLLPLIGRARERARL